MNSRPPTPALPESTTDMLVAPSETLAIGTLLGLALDHVAQPLPSVRRELAYVMAERDALDAEWADAHPFATELLREMLDDRIRRLTRSLLRVGAL